MMATSGQQLAQKRSTKRLRAFCLLFLALALRLWLAPMRGHVHDLDQFKEWTRVAVTGNLLTIYSDSTANYPPLVLLPLAGVGALYRLYSPEFDLSAPELTGLVKLPAIVADLLTVVLIYRLVREQWGERPAVMCAALYAFNPAVWYTSAWWGQLESVYTYLLVLALASAVDGRTKSAWAWLAAAILVKPHAAVVLPVLIVSAWKEGGWRTLAWGLLVGGSVLTLVLAPLAWAGQLPALWAQLQASIGKQLFLTMNAHSLWYLLSMGKGSFAARGDNPIYDTKPLVGPFTGWQIGLVLLAVWGLFVFVAAWRRSRTRMPDAFLPAAALVMGLFVLPTESHERYLFPALALLSPLLPGSRSVRWLYLGLSLTLFLNLLWVDPAVPLPGYPQELRWGLPTALLNTASLGLAAWALVRSGNGASSSRAG